MKLKTFYQYLQDSGDFSTVPGPSMTKTLRFIKEVRRDPLAIMQDYQSQYGEIVRLPVPGLPFFQVSEPELISKLLLGTERTNQKSVMILRLRRLFGNGLLTSQGPLWRQQRQLATPAFSPAVIQRFAPMIAAETKAMIASWNLSSTADREVSITEEMTKLTFSVIAKVLFSADIAADALIVRDVMAVVQRTADSLFYELLPTPHWVPTVRNRELQAAMARVHAIVAEVVAEHRRAPERYNDLLSAFLNMRDEESGKGIDDTLLRDQMVTLLFGGHETTSFSLSMTLDYLSRSAAQQESLYAETHAVEAESEESERLKLLPYLNAVIQEGMRIQPAFWAYSREATAEIRYRDCRFPIGSTFIILPYLVFRSAKLWQVPHEFHPERFLPEASQGRHPFQFFPFGGGPRACIGAGIARLESQIILTELSKHCRFAAVPGYRYKLLPKVSLTADPGVRLLVRKR